MSPSLPTARPIWFWSLPTFAIILSFLWYRKKRASLKTCNGGAVEETQDDQKSVVCEEEPEKPAEKIVSKGGESNEISDQNRDEVVEIVDKVEVVTQLESVSQAWRDFSKLEPVIAEVVHLEEKEETEVNAEEAKEEENKKENNNNININSNNSNNNNNNNNNNNSNSNNNNNNSKYSKKKKLKKMNDSSVDERQENEGNTACILEQKLAELDLSGQQYNTNVEKKPLNEDVAERDSANNSPSEVMLASPSVSGYSDTHSEGSSDSGKGCSEMLTPSRTPASGNSVSGDLPVTSVYEFEIPQYLVGRLIGRHGCHLYEIKKATNTSIYIKKHPVTKELKICAIEGTQMDIDSALDMIRHRFSKKRFPDLSLEQVVISTEPLMFPIFPENYQLYLIEGINNDVILSSLVTAGHFFLQQPTHPTFPALSRLNSCMASCYSEPNQPNIPEGVGAGVLCAAPVHDGWYRAQITDMEEGREYCCVKFVDYGGYMTLPVSSLRQIRADFINLPFQAAECYLAGVKPLNDENVWSEEAKETVEKLTFGNILQAQVHGYVFPGVPLIYLYTVVNNEFILINEELVNRGYAEWLYCEPVTEEMKAEDGAVACSEIEIENAEPVAVPI